MPYRRLPNTDNSRLKAMQLALQMSEEVPPFKLSFSVTTHQEVKFFYPEFNQAIQLQKETLERQTKQNKNHQEKLKKARLYISHFIQVLNFAIIRGELPLETREIFGLDTDEKKLPQLNSEKDIAKWGEKLIKGEQKRLTKGLTPITNPNIARVKVHFEDYIKIHNTQLYLQDAYNKALKEISKLRIKADDIIVKIWNEVEEHYSNLPADEKRETAEKFGVVYVYRKNEKMNFNNLKLEKVN